MFVALLSLLRAWCVGASVVSSASYLRAFAQVQTAVSLFVVQRVRRRWFCAWLRVVTASTPMWETRTHARTHAHVLANTQGGPGFVRLLPVS